MDVNLDKRKKSFPKGCYKSFCKNLKKTALCSQGPHKTLSGHRNPPNEVL
uniref:Uncharacterized protein n=1 Tax=Chlorella vulgaris TaxID=3077 RepID=V9H1A5_CHLVU|nr:hypothetical protein ChvulCp122 [Chlorella vulgaris]pir/T07309/ hypothetical protein 49e - Chlorella vulgaris chloroplast [Chlorella vulgaris]BAA57957.1 unnamed protein product [Chlorella vulgaris]